MFIFLAMPTADPSWSDMWLHDPSIYMYILLIIIMMVFNNWMDCLTSLFEHLCVCCLTISNFAVIHELKVVRYNYNVHVQCLRVPDVLYALLYYQRSNHLEVACTELMYRAETTTKSDKCITRKFTVCRYSYTVIILKSPNHCGYLNAVKGFPSGLPRSYMGPTLHTPNPAPVDPLSGQLSLS